MKATLLLDVQELFVTEAGGTVEIHMDLYEVTKKKGQPEYRFSWIAFDTDNPMRRVLFDCHPPKGPHFHLDEDSEGQSFQWISIDEAIRFFREKVKEHFGELVEVPDDGGQRT